MKDYASVEFRNTGAVIVARVRSLILGEPNEGVAFFATGSHRIRIPYRFQDIVRGTLRALPFCTKTVAIEGMCHRRQVPALFLVPIESRFRKQALMPCTRNDDMIQEWIAQEQSCFRDFLR